MPKKTDLLLEYRHQGGRQTWAFRFYQDGLVQEYSDSTMAFEDGKIVTHSLPLAWREIARLTPAELERVIAALRQVDFFSLPGKLGDSSRAKDASPFSWMANLDGQKKTVLATGAEATNYPAIKLLREMVQAVTADAFERQAGKN